MHVVCHDDGVGYTSGPSNTLELPEFGLRLLQDPGKGYAGYVWPAALSLCGCLELEAARHNGSLNGLRVLELGAGCGLAGLVAARLGARVTLTDSEDAIGQLHANAVANATVAPDVEVSALRFGRDIRALFSRGAFDIVIGSDITYFGDAQEELLTTVLQLVGESTVLLLSHGMREAAVTESLHAMLLKFFDVEAIKESEACANLNYNAVQLTDYVSDTYGPNVKVVTFRAILRNHAHEGIERITEEQIRKCSGKWQYPLRNDACHVVVFQSKDVPGFRPFRVLSAELVMCAYLEQIAEQLCGSRVLNLAAGCGLAGLVAAYSGASVILADTAEIEPHLQLTVATNAQEIMRAGGTASVVICDFAGKGAVPAALANCRFDFIILGDLASEPILQERMLKAMRQFMGDGTTALVAHTDRFSDGFDFPWVHYKMMQLLLKKFLSWSEVTSAEVVGTTESMLKIRPDLAGIWESSWVQQVYDETSALPITLFRVCSAAVTQPIIHDPDTATPQTNSEALYLEGLSAMD